MQQAFLKNMYGVGGGGGEEDVWVGGGEGGGEEDVWVGGGGGGGDVWAEGEDAV